MIGVWAGITSAFFATSKDLISKRLSTSLSGRLSAFSSFLFALPFYFIALLVMSHSSRLDVFLMPTFLAYVALRSISDSFAETFKMLALQHCEVSLVSALVTLSPLFLLVLSPLLTGDPLTEYALAAVVLVVIGSLMFITARPVSTNKALHARGVLFGLGAAFFFAVNTCFDRLASTTGGPIVSGFAVTFLSAVILLPIAGLSRSSFSLLSASARPLFVRGLFEVIFMVSKLVALLYLPAPQVNALQRSSVLLSVIGGGMFFKEGNIVRKLCASILIISGVALIALEQSH